jgi:hypothetical protein
MPRPPLNRILETSLYVSNLDRAVAFYKTVFEFDTLLADHRMHALAVLGKQVLLLFRKGGSVTASLTPFDPIPPHDAHGQQHLCFRSIMLPLMHGRRISPKPVSSLKADSSGIKVALASISVIRTAIQLKSGRLDFG